MPSLRPNLGAAAWGWQLAVQSSSRRVDRRTRREFSLHTADCNCGTERARLREGNSQGLVDHEPSR
jgi:hypothetical protein